MRYPKKADRRDRGTASMVAILGFFALMVALATLALTANTTNARHSSEAKDDADLTMLTNAALSQALAEINTQTDHDGDGHLGCVGVAGTAVGHTNPARLTNSAGVVIGEFKTYVVNKAATPLTDPPNYVIRAIVAAPSFAAVAAANAITGSSDEDVRRRSVRDRIRVAEALVRSNAGFLLQPKAGALSFSGPLNSDPDLLLNHSGLSIDGRDPGPDGIRGTGDDVAYPAFMFTDQASMDNFTRDDQVDIAWTNGSPTLGSRITGGSMTTFDRKSGNDNSGAAGSPATYTAPFKLEAGAAFNATMLNNYRDALISYAHGLAHATVTNAGTVDETVTVDYAAAAADTSLPGGAGAVILHQHASVKDGAGAGKPRMVSNLNFGTAGVSTATVILDSSKFEGGMQGIADKFGDDAGGRTLSGNGTLIILHPIGSASDSNDTAKIPNLNWTGNVFIIGYPRDTKASTTTGNNPTTDNLLYLDRTDWNVNGNMMLLTTGAMEPSLEAKGNDAGTDKATLTVNGSLLVFGDANTAEVDIEMESAAELTVNGMLGAYGARLEIESQSASTRMIVDGTFALGTPAGNTRQDNSGGHNSDDLSLRINANNDFTFHKAKVEAAVEKMTTLQQSLQLSSNNLSNLDFTFDSIMMRGNGTRTTWATYNTQLAGLVAANSARGVDVNLVVNNNN